MSQLNIKIIGVGEGGAAAVNKMIAASIGGGNVEFISVGADENIMLTSSTRKNLFLNRQAVDLQKNFSEALAGAKLIFIVGGLGSTSARVAFPLIIDCAKNLAATTVALVCRPFVLENYLRKTNAEFNIKNLRGKVDTLIDVPAEKFFLFRMKQTEVSLAELFDVADEIFCRGVKIFLDVLTDETSLPLCRWGDAAFGYGTGKTALDAVKAAAKFPTFAADDIARAAGIFVSITAGKTLKLKAVEAANDFIRRKMKDDAEFFAREDVDAALAEKIFASIILTRSNAAG